MKRFHMLVVCSARKMKSPSPIALFPSSFSQDLTKRRKPQPHILESVRRTLSPKLPRLKSCYLGKFWSEKIRYA